MKTLLLMRHAKSSWKDSDQDDYDRTLNKRGKRDAPRMGQLLKDEQLLPDLVLASSAKRCRKTAEHVIHESGYRGETRFVAELYEADADRIAAVLESLPDHALRLLVIAHNPGLETFVEQLTGEYTPLTTAALAHVELPIELWSELAAVRSAKLVKLWQPRELE